VKASIIVLYYQGKNYIEDCLDSILNEKDDFEVVLVDNGSNDEGIKKVKKRYERELKNKKIRIIHSKKNRGFAGGNNLGVNHAKGKNIILLNQDTRVYKDWFENMLEPLEDESIALVMPRKTKRSQATTMSLTQSTHPTKARCTRGLCDRFNVGGSCLAFRKKYFPIPFPESYFAYAEDTFIGWRSKLRGKRNVFTNKAKIWHAGGSVRKKNKLLEWRLSFHGIKNELLNHAVFYNPFNALRILPLLWFVQFSKCFLKPRLFLLGPLAWIWVFTHPLTVYHLRKEINSERIVSDKEIISELSYKSFSEKHSFNKQRAFRVARSVLDGVLFLYCFVFRIKTREFI